MLFMVFLLSGCSMNTLREKIEWLDEKIGEAYESFQDDQSEKLLDFMDEKQEDVDVWKNLTADQKNIIEEWIKSNNFNEYGDLFDTVYEKGSPLIQDGFEEIKNRFEYILENHPELLEKIK